MDFWTVFNWLWGGTDCHEILWPSWWALAIAISGGLIEFLIYQFVLRWLGKEYGSMHGFQRFFIGTVKGDEDPAYLEELRERWDSYRSYLKGKV